MECLQIDWENIDDKFERDEFYESIQAPKWIDFTAPPQPVDDHEWFCGRAGCTHVNKTLWQTEDSILSDPQKSTGFQIDKKVAPVAENTASGVGGKRARAVVSSSYSSLSGIKEAFAKHKVLHLAKMPCVTESYGQGSAAHASENQNPNQTCKAQLGVSKIPILKASDGLSKKIKMTDRQYVAGKPPPREVLAGVSKLTCSTFSEHLTRSHTRAVLDVSKSTTLLDKKDLVQKKSIPSRTAVKEQDIKVLTAVCGASESKNKKVEAARIPFSVYTSRSATTSSLAMPSKRPTMPTRSLHNVQLGNEKSASCRPPRIVARKEEQAGVINVSTYLERDGCRKLTADMLPCENGQAKHMTPMLNKRKLEDNAVLAYAACVQDEQTHTSNDNEECASAQPMVQEQCSTIKDKPVTSLVCDGEKQQSHCGKDNEREHNARHVFTEEKEDTVQSTLEKHLENLYLSTPSNKLAPHTHKHYGVKVEMGRLDHLNNVLNQEMGRSQCVESVDSVVDLEMMSSQHEDNVLSCEMEISDHVKCAAKHKEVLSLYADISCEMNQPLNSQNVGYVNYSASQMSGGFVDCMHTAEELLAPLSGNMDSQRNPKQLQPVKDWQRKRGLKRKSSELNFKVNCSSKEHIHENDKVPTSASAVSSFICQQAKQSFLTRSLVKAPPSSGFIDSCKEQHKKIKTTKAQPFKPFRLRTEERGALRELGLGRKEQVVPNPQELVHHALRMPSFGHPFRPQRSTKKLTVPKEPSFHSSRMRKTCTGPPTLLGS